MKNIFIGVIVSFFLMSNAFGMTDMISGMSKLGITDGKTEALRLKSCGSAEIAPKPLAMANKTEELETPDKEIYGDHARLRFFMRGDEAKYYAMFNRAVEQKDAVLQVALANAFFASIWDQDARKDFSVFDPKKFKNFIFNKYGYVLYDSLYFATFEMSTCDAAKIYAQAAAESFVPAIITQIMFPNRTGCPKPSDCKELSRLAALGYPEAMLLYGKLLFWTFGDVSPYIKELGLNYMCNSGLLHVKCSPKPEGLEAPAARCGRFYNDYEKNNLGSDASCYYAWMLFITSDVVLVPSQEHYDEMCKKLPPLRVPTLPVLSLALELISKL